MSMLTVLHEIEQMLPKILTEGQWSSCGVNGLRCEYFADYIIEIYQTNQPIIFLNNPIIKLVAGCCLLEAECQKSNNIISFACESGFDFCANDDDVTTTITPSHDDVLILVIYEAAKNYPSTAECEIAGDILQEFKMYYPAVTAKTNRETAPKSPTYLWRISHEVQEKSVIVEFAQATRWLALSPEEAEKAGAALLHHARKARGF